MWLIVFTFIAILLPSLSLSTEIKNIAFPQSVSQFERFEVRFDIDKDYTNPFDTDEVDVWAEIKAPSGITLSVPAFYTQDFERYLKDGIERFKAVGSPYWAIRFTPVETGNYRFLIKVKDKDGISQTDILTFESIPSNNKGFVRVNRENPFYFSFDNGEPYIPIGFNIAWASDDSGSFYYDHFLEKLHNAGGNYVRIWMSHYYQGQTIEWSDSHPSGLYHGAGIYSLEAASRIDRIVEKAESLGIYIQLVLLYHTAFETSIWSSWDENPYNIKNGGMLNSSMEFFSNLEANRLFDRRLRYIIARWGYSTHILSWEIFNEVDGITGYYENRDIVKKWHIDKIQKIKSWDIYNHLITTSFTSPYFLDDHQFWEMEGLDYTQYHAYLAPLFGISYQIVKSAESLKKFNKPTFAGEFGIYWLPELNSYDPEGINIHNGIWASLLSGNAGSAMSWWWYDYIEPNNLWHHLRGAAEFVKDENLADYPDVFYRGVGIFDLSPVEVIGIKSKSGALFWVHDKKSEWDKKPSSQKRDDVTVKVEGLIDGEYSLEFWDTENGEIIERKNVKVQEGTAEIKIIPFKGDIGVKMKYKNEFLEGCGCVEGKNPSFGLIITGCLLILLFSKSFFDFKQVFGRDFGS